MIFVTPQSLKDLIKKGNQLISTDEKEIYSLIEGVPVLLPEKTNPDWCRELLEIIFWEHTDVITKIYEEIKNDDVADWNEVYLKYIKETHGTKENILKAFDSYKQKETDIWINGDKSGNITKAQIKEFKKFNKLKVLALFGTDTDTLES